MAEANFDRVGTGVNVGANNLYAQQHGYRFFEQFASADDDGAVYSLVSDLIAKGTPLESPLRVVFHGTFGEFEFLSFVCTYEGLSFQMAATRMKVNRPNAVFLPKEKRFHRQFLQNWKLLHELRPVEEGLDARRHRLYGSDVRFAFHMYQRAQARGDVGELPWLSRADWLVTWRAKTSSLHGREGLQRQLSLLAVLAEFAFHVGPSQ